MSKILISQVVFSTLHWFLVKWHINSLILLVHSGQNGSIKRFSGSPLLDSCDHSLVHPVRSRRQRQMLLLRWRAEELGTRRWPLAGTCQVVSTVTTGLITGSYKYINWIHYLPPFAWTKLQCLCSLLCICAFADYEIASLYCSQMWVFNPVEGAGIYQQHTRCSFPSGWHCGEDLYPS